MGYKLIHENKFSRKYDEVGTVIYGRVWAAARNPKTIFLIQIADCCAKLFFIRNMLLISFKNILMVVIIKAPTPSDRFIHELV